MTRDLHLYNSDGRVMQKFSPRYAGKVGLYCCGPTVYNYAHIGNLRAYTEWDVLRRTLERFNHEVRHIMNITDVGHLSDDGDAGEDKMLKGAREQKRTVWEVAEFFTDAFMKDIGEMNILMPHVSCKATEHIEQMIRMIARLEERGFSYQAGGNVYFDTSRLSDYGRMALLDRQHGDTRARIEADEHKINPHDFVLWFTRSKFENQAMMWNSPWGKGYPGWHIECSAMSSHYLGEYIDIHTGGVDHIPVHHSNEIAQSEAAFGHRWVNFWIHNEFLLMKSGKMSKAENNFITLQGLKDEGYEPLDYRYFLLGGHYQSQLVFSPESMDSAAAARKSLYGRIVELGRMAGIGFGAMAGSGARGDWTDAQLGDLARAHLEAFDRALSDNLNTPRALAVLWGLVKNNDVKPPERLAVALNMDRALGMKLEDALIATNPMSDVPERIKVLMEKRNQARRALNWSKADAIRADLFAEGWRIIDEAGISRLERV